jgi:cell division protein FtsB
MREAKSSKLTEILGKISKYAIIVLVLLFLASLIRSLSRITKSKDRIGEARSRVEKLQKENEELKVKLDTSQSEAFIESQLRDKLGLAKEGEIVIVLPEASILRQVAPKFEYEEEVLPDPTWKQWLKLFY